MTIHEASEDNVDELIDMEHSMWPHCSKQELREEFDRELNSDHHQHFLAKNKRGIFIAFISLSLRTDYVEGSTSSPVGYVEGIFVKPYYRRRGVASILMREGEMWARKKGIREMASDTPLKNKRSQKFHKRAAYHKSDIIVHYIKSL